MGNDGDGDEVVLRLDLKPLDFDQTLAFVGTVAAEIAAIAAVNNDTFVGADLAGNRVARQWTATVSQLDGNGGLLFLLTLGGRWLTMYLAGFDFTATHQQG